MRRWLFNLAAAVSLILCLAVGVLWVWSHYDAWDLMLVRQRLAADGRTDVWQYALTNIPGTLELHWSHSRQDGPFEIPEEVALGKNGLLRSVQFHHGLPENAPRGNGDPILRRLGLWFYRLSGTRVDLPAKPSYHVIRLGLADWLLMVLFCAPLAIRAGVWWRHRRHQARSRAGRCPTCGYDLRATPERCPECGKEVTAR